MKQQNGKEVMIMKQQNAGIRKTVEENGLKLWQIAQQVGVTDATFSRWLREELTGERLERVNKAIVILCEEDNSWTESEPQ